MLGVDTGVGELEASSVVGSTISNAVEGVEAEAIFNKKCQIEGVEAISLFVDIEQLTINGQSISNTKRYFLKSFNINNHILYYK